MRERQNALQIHESDTKKNRVPGPPKLGDLGKIQSFFHGSLKKCNLGIWIKCK